MAAGNRPGAQQPCIRVVVQYAARATGLPEESDFQRWAAAVAAPGGQSLQLTIRLVGETEGRRLNRDHRGEDRATNVLSFPGDWPEHLASELSEQTGYRFIGDLAICAAVVAREAAGQGKPAEEHWAHLVVHGILHLLGYDHVHEKDARVMEQLEIRILAGLGIPDPYTPGEAGENAENDQ